MIVELPAKLLCVIGTVTVIAVCVALIALCVRSIVRSVTDFKYALKVKYYLKDTQERIARYDREISEVRQIVYDLRKEMHGKN